MICRHNPAVLPFEPLSAQSRNARIRIYKPLEGGGSEQYYYFRIYEFYLAIEIRQARSHFIGFRISVFRRPALYYVSYEYMLVACESACKENLVQQFAGFTYERLPSHIFIISRTFPYAHNRSVPVSLPENRIMPCFAQGTFSTGQNFGTYLLQFIHTAELIKNYQKT